MKRSRLVSSPTLYSLGTIVYDWLTSHPLQRAAFDSVVEHLPEEGRVLDLCCGPGALLRRMGERRPRLGLCGVDLASRALVRARPYAPVARAAAERLPFADDTFDAVVISGALYLVADPVAVLREMARVCRGRVLVLEASPGMDWRSVIHPRSGLGLKERTDFALWLVAMRMARRFGQQELQGVLERAGLGMARVDAVARDLYLLGHGDA